MGLNDRTNYHNNFTQIVSPLFERSEEHCRLIVDISTRSTNDVQHPVKVLLQTGRTTSFVNMENIQNDTDR